MTQIKVTLFVGLICFFNKTEAKYSKLKLFPIIHGIG